MEQTFPQNPGQSFSPLPSLISNDFFFFLASEAPYILFSLIGAFMWAGRSRVRTQNFIQCWEKPSHPGGGNKSSSGINDCFQQALAKTVHLSGTAAPRGLGNPGPASI